ncbi:diaminopimelate epimerase [Marinicauda pacifica]|jgi:diaminopimelate epimerase|uniref:diaminopimelate epimerase n=1 Tax=Marinicauda pacifica TaxID=1133559 RepID=UPI0035C874D8
MKSYAMNGAGNAFVLIDARGRSAPLSLPAERVAAIHARHAFDQLLTLETHPVETALLRVWNSDGGEVGACGNGARAAAWLLFEQDGGETLSMSSRGGRLTARRLEDGRAEVNLGRPRLSWRNIPLSRDMDTEALDYEVHLPGGGRLTRPGAVSMGNPHVTFTVSDVMAIPIAQIGPMIEHDILFPQRVNAGFAEIRGSDRIRLRVWERGAGLTQACGTGACAAVVALHRQGKLGRAAEVEVDGGRLGVRWAEDDDLYLTGPVELEREVDLGGLLS